MPKVTLIAHDGTATALDIPEGTSVMLGAVRANLKGIRGDCAGNLLCSTCHVYVEPEWLAKLPAPENEELVMLDFTAAERRENSRLSCQIKMSAALEGLVVRTPEEQY